MTLSEALRVPRGITAFVGGGGKTTAIRRLAMELSERGRVLGFIQAGAANYLMKPFTAEDLATKITGSLGNAF